MSVHYRCDHCGRPISPTASGGEAMMPIGAPTAGGGAIVSAALGDGRRVRIDLGPVSVEGLSNAHHWHKSCVLALAAEGEF